MAAPPPKKKRNTKRILWISTAVVAVIAVATVGVIALKPGRTGNSAVVKVKCQSTDLTTCLIKAPAGAVELSGTADSWAQETTPSTELYQPIIAQDTQGVGADTASQLSADGMHKIVHVDWNAVDGNDVDLVLLQFGTQKGAQSWNSTRSAEILAAYRGKAVAIPGDSTAKAHTATAVDTQGNIDAAYSTVVGNLVLNVTYSSPKQLSAQDLATWAGTELASVRTAPPAAADPAPTPPGTEQIACGAQLTACLTPLPHGAERWTDPTSKLWVSSATLTQSQFIQLQWTESSQQTIASSFTTDGVTGIAHTDWTTDDADKQADIYLVQTITASGATQLAQSDFGEPTWNVSSATGVSFAIPNEPQAQAWYANKKDSNGLVEFYFMQVVGNVIVHGWMFFYGSFDASTATSWAQSQLNVVTQNSSTQPMGMFPLTAPTLPAAVQGTCPASGDCLLPLPTGATDTTSSSYVAGENLDAPSYADQYESYLSTDVGTWLQSDGFVNGAHRSWTDADGSTADAALLKYGSPAQAQAAALLEYGTSAQNDRVCTDAALPDSMCLASTVDTTDYLQDETIRVLAWKGDYEVSISLTVSNEADLADAYALLQQQLDMLPAS